MIAIYNLEPKYFNLALEKVRKFYENQGEVVDDYKPLWHDQYDKIYCSSIFTWTDKSTVTPDMICGGTGFDLTTELPPEIEAVKVRKNKGFTTRGCIRKCPFCVVPKKEGKIRAVGDIYDLWDGKSKEIILYDNNILALPQHLKVVCKQLNQNNLMVDFNQGLDIRLLTDEICRILKNTKVKTYRFSWDFMSSEKEITSKIPLLKKHKINNCMIFVLVNYNTIIGEDLYRRNKVVNEWGYDAFIMVYDKPNAPQIIKHLARWNNRFMLRSQMFEDYLKDK